ncbi:MAG: hypothetical protein CMN77_06605 [Spirochaetaceae bacterium]|nr:hypothetical protein [Spirochaetaceae bacterium]|tara:strand:- start:15626 stop:16993 length:1368 start_codon:yes stop_codon:yes gene_type:complete
MNYIPLFSSNQTSRSGIFGGTATSAGPGLRRSVWSILVVFLLVSSLLSLSCRGNQDTTIQGNTMGTSYSIKLRHVPRDLDVAELKDQIDELLHTVDFRFSSWQQDELYRINSHPVGQTTEISSDFCLVLYKSSLVWKASDGEFDPTIGRLIDLWGFGPSEQTRGPTDQEVSQAKKQIGFDKLQIRYLPGVSGKDYESDTLAFRNHEKDSGQKSPGSNNAASDDAREDSSDASESTTETEPGDSRVHEDSAERYRQESGNDAPIQGCSLVRTTDLNLNLSAIAKGHGVDRVANLLRKNGIQDFMVEIGGEVKTGPEGSFRIGIERPNYDGTRSLYTVLESQNSCIATSGNYRNFFEKDGKIYSHILDPETGRPGLSRIQSATIVGPDCALADALATAAMILSPEQTRKMLTSIKEITGQSYEYLILESGELVHGDTRNFQITEYTSSGLDSIRVQK